MQNKSIHLAIILGSLLLASSYALCQDRVAEAKSEFDRGVALYNEGLYDEAAKAFRKANEIKPTWSLLFNIAQSEAAAQRYDLAYEAFEEYLAKGGDAIDNKRRELVTTELDKMQKLIGSLEVSAPPGAIVSVDGFERGIAPLPGRLKLAVSVIHTVRVRLDGGVLLSENVKVSQGENVRLEAVAKPYSSSNADESRPETAAAPITDKRTDESEENSMIPGARIIGWVGMGIGIPALVAAAATGGIALSIDKDMKKVCKDNICPADQKKRLDTRNALGQSCNGLLIAGVAATGVGIGFLVWSLKAKKESEAQQAVSIVPIIGGRAAALSISGRF